MDPPDKFGQWLDERRVSKEQHAVVETALWNGLIDLALLQRKLLAMSGIAFDAGNYAEGSTLDQAALTKLGDDLRNQIFALQDELMK